MYEKKEFIIINNFNTCLLIRYNLYDNLIPNFIYDIINPRQIQGVLNIIFYLGVVFQAILIVLLVIDYKKIKIQDLIIIILSLLFLIYFIVLMLTV